MAVSWYGDHLFKSMTSKKASDDSCSGTVFLPQSALSTCAMLVLMHRLAVEKPRFGGMGSNSKSAESVFHYCLASAFGGPLKIRIGIVDNWVWKFPRPRADAPHTFLLEIEADGSVNVKPMYEFAESEALDDLPAAKEVLSSWLSLLDGHHTDGIVHVESLLTLETQDHA